jgi:hypothetical protein
VRPGSASCWVRSGGGQGQRDCRILTLLDLLAIAGVIATIGCQRGTAPTILNKIADYVLALEGHQGTVHDVALFAAGKAKAFAEASVSRYLEPEGDHGAPPLKMPQEGLLRAIREFRSPMSVFAGRGRGEAGWVRVQGRRSSGRGDIRFSICFSTSCPEGKGNRRQPRVFVGRPSPPVFVQGRSPWNEVSH